MLNNILGVLYNTMFDNNQKKTFNGVERKREEYQLLHANFCEMPSFNY